MDIGTIVAIGIGVIILFAILFGVIVAAVNAIAEKGDEVLKIEPYYPERERTMTEETILPSGRYFTIDND